MPAVYSMTGSASRQINTETGDFSIEISSVNGRYLEMYFKLPDRLKHLESALRKLVQSRFSRGKFEICVSAASGLSSALRINEHNLQALAEALAAVTARVGGEVNPLEILAYPGVLESDQALRGRLDELILENFGETLAELKHSRECEGENLARAVRDRLRGVAAQLDQLSPMLENLVSLERRRLQAKLETLSLTLDPERLEQEIALAAQKADIREEYDRLRSHVKETGRILDQGGQIGKRLDFMMQEFNREANTLASKSSHLDITRAAVEIKVLVEQMREQVQNIE